MRKKKIRHGIKDLFSGDFITKMKLDRYMLFVFCLFWLVAGFITWNLYVENVLIKVSDNRGKLEILEIQRDQTTLKLLELNHKDIIENLLIKNNSNLAAPTEPAAIITKR